MVSLPNERLDFHSAAASHAVQQLESELRKVAQASTFLMLTNVPITYHQEPGTGHVLGKLQLSPEAA